MQKIEVITVFDIDNSYENHVTLVTNKYGKTKTPTRNATLPKLTIYNKILKECLKSYNKF